MSCAPTRGSYTRRSGREGGLVTKGFLDGQEQLGGNKSHQLGECTGYRGTGYRGFTVHQLAVAVVTHDVSVLRVN